MNNLSIKNDIFTQIIIDPSNTFNHKYKNLEIYQKICYSDKVVFLGFYKRTFTISKRTFYEFVDYDKNTTCISLDYTDFQKFYVLNVKPPKMTDEMKTEIKYHPYNLFVQKNIENYLSEETKKYFYGNIYNQ